MKKSYNTFLFWQNVYNTSRDGERAVVNKNNFLNTILKLFYFVIKLIYFIIFSWVYYP